MSAGNKIRLIRGHAFEMGTPGRLILPSGWECSTMERPWLDNETYVSCVPPGRYPLRLRHSEVVRRASKGRYAKGWEVADVPGRSYIMFHPGNTIDDSEGCILPGRVFSAWMVEEEMRWAVTSSQDTFAELMRELNNNLEWEIEIKYFDPETETWKEYNGY